ncbi:hypothetical protein [Planomonospora algeriensis]
MTAPTPASGSGPGPGSGPGSGSGPGPGSGAHEHPEPRGLHMMILGSVLAVLAPLAGFLGGSMAGHSGGTTGLSPLFLWMFGGLVIGAIGAVIAITGGLRWVRARHVRKWHSEEDD